MCLLVRTDDVYKKFVILHHCQQQDMNTCVVQFHTKEGLSYMKCKHSLFKQLVINLFSLWNLLLITKNISGKINCTQIFIFSSLVSKFVLILESTKFTLLFN